MPQIPSYGEPRATPAARPTLRLPTEAPLSAFGGGREIGQAFNEAGKTANMAEALLLQEKKQVDETAAMEAWNKLERVKGDILGKLSQRKGKDAIGAGSDVRDEFRKAVSEINSGLTSQTQKRGFLGMSSRTEADLDQTTEAHISRQTGIWKDEVDEETLLTLRRMAAGAGSTGNEDDMFRAINGQSKIVEQMAERNGHDKDWVLNRTKEIWSKSYREVIERMLAGERYGDAAAYFKKNEEFLIDEDRLMMEKATKQGAEQGDVFAASDRIWAKGGTREEILERAEKTSSDIRAKVVDHLNGRLHRRDQAEKADHDDIVENTVDLVTDPKVAEEGSSVEELVGTVTWSRLSERERKGITLAYNAARGMGERVTDPHVNGSFWALGYDELAGLTEADMFRRFYEGMSQAAYDQALHHLGAVKNDPNRQIFLNASDKSQMIFDTMSRLNYGGAIPGQKLESVYRKKGGSPETAAAFGEIKEAFDQKEIVWQTANPTKKIDSAVQRDLAMQVINEANQKFTFPTMLYGEPGSTKEWWWAEGAFLKDRHTMTANDPRIDVDGKGNWLDQNKMLIPQSVLQNYYDKTVGEPGGPQRGMTLEQFEKGWRGRINRAFVLDSTGKMNPVQIQRFIVTGER